MSERQPVRTCVGCGGRDPQRGLLRFVRGSAGLEVDLDRRRGGRGAYLHARPECWAVFARRRGPVRSLRATPAVAERERLASMLSVPAAGSER